MTPPPIAGPCLGFQVFGTPVWLHWSFPGVGLGVGVPVGACSYFAASELALALFLWSVGAVTLLVLVHELGHAVAARLLRMRVHGICLAAGGGCCLTDGAEHHGHEALYSASGLLAQGLLLAGTSLVFWQADAARAPWLTEGAAVLTAVNALLLAFNAWPRGGSDGHRVLGALRALHAKAR